MKVLKTSCGLSIKVDNNDYEFLKQFKWFRLKARNTTYARTNYNKKTKVMTHLIALNNGWDIKGKVIDHKNKNGLDNRKENLEILTQRENVTKDAGWKKSSSKYRNVAKVKNRWVARIYVKGKDYYLGYFDTEELAYEAVKQKRQEVGY